MEFKGKSGKLSLTLKIYRNIPGRPDSDLIVRGSGSFEGFPVNINILGRACTGVWNIGIVIHPGTGRKEMLGFPRAQIPKLCELIFKDAYKMFLYNEAHNKVF